MANSNGNGGYVGLARSLVSALPPAFLLLVLLNIAFMWFLDNQLDQRTRMAEKILTECLDGVRHK